MKQYKQVSFADVDITGGFWAKRQEVNREVTLGAVRDRFLETGRFDAFCFRWNDDCDAKLRPHIFWDSDVAKWLESVAYLMAKQPGDATVREMAGLLAECVEAIVAHQAADGYFNSYYQVLEPQNRFTVRDNHELYCAGHLMEAAVAYFEATGERRFLDAMCRYADLIERVFMHEQSAAFFTPGHEEIELALVKLARVTGEQRYLALAKHFIDRRGVADDEPLTAWSRRSYNQSHIPVREQRTPEGHAVRACYLYAGMADVAGAFEDAELFDACRTIFEHMTGRRMYVTGGIGSTHIGEAFTIDYDLPNATAYAETCAAIALMLFARRMSALEPRGVYADIAERAMYNGFLSGVSLDVRAFFYENPLAITLADRGRHTSVADARERLPLTQRREVFDCSCCPPNVTRVVASIGDYVYAHDDNTLFVHHYMESRARFAFGDREIEIEQATKYPYDGAVRVTVRNARDKVIALRVPGWCRSYTLDGVKAECFTDGYVYISVFEDVCAFSIVFEMEPVIVYAHPAVRENAGRCALQRGPIVYCVEGVDNGDNLQALRVRVPLQCRVEQDEKLGMPVIVAAGLCVQQGKGGGLYGTAEPEYAEQEIRLIPYHAFANRGESDMLVWFLTRE